jgi:glycosyltransferase involved in cell wall biosynthesis
MVERSRVVSVVLPCLNEAASVGRCVTDALDALAKGGLVGEVIVVDNGSTDDSAAIATAAGARMVAEPRPGYGRALRTGFAAAQGEVVVMADADCTYQLDLIPRLVGPVFADEADLVVASRLDSATRSTMPFLHRYVGTPTLTFLTARACGRRVVSDSQSGFRAFRRSALPAMSLHSSGMELASEMLIRSARAGLRITEIPSTYSERVGSSKLDTWRDGLRHLNLVFLLAPDLLLIGPALVLIALGLIMLAVAFVWPAGIDVGSLVWQPVFFSGVALVLGTEALLAGAVLAHNSAVASPGIRDRFAFVGDPRFPMRCLASGIGFVVAGLLVNLGLFVAWLVGSHASSAKHLGFASLSESLIIVGGAVASFGLVSRFLRTAAVREGRLVAAPAPAPGPPAVEVSERGEAAS